MVALWIAVGVLSFTVLLLVCKILSMQKATREIAEDFAEHLQSDTNTLICVATRDRHVRALAVAINRELRTLREQRLRYQNGDRELKDAVTNISHDLRTPLTAICGYLNLLEKQEKNPEVERYLGYIKNRTESLRALTEELFRYSVILSVDAGMSAEPLSLNAVLEESIAAFYGALIQKGIEPNVTMPTDAVRCNLNRQALGRIFSNIIGNAIKYSDGDLRIVLQADGKIFFSNSAVALTEIQVGRLFDRFYSVETAQNSTGLGLSIARALTEQMGGEISAVYEEKRLCILLSFVV